MAQDERRGFEIVDDFPFMLRHSKHSEPFFRSLLVTLRYFQLIFERQFLRLIPDRPPAFT
jgi:hypothetical protein